MDYDESYQLLVSRPADRGGLLQDALLIIRGEPVVLASTIATAFGVSTREINQAARRNPHKFGDRHRFELNQAEIDFLISHDVIAKPGRGGSRARPHVYNQKGVARLATILDSPAALQATDQMIDLCIQIYKQLAAGTSEIKIAQPDRYFRSDADLKRVGDIREKLYAAVSNLLTIELDSRTGTTVADEMGLVAGSALGMLKAHLNAKSLENDKVEAETLLVLEKVREIRDRTAADVRRSNAESDSIILENMEKRLKLAERFFELSKKLEPDQFALINNAFSQRQSVLRVPALPEDPDV